MSEDAYDVTLFSLSDMLTCRRLNFSSDAVRLRGQERPGIEAGKLGGIHDSAMETAPNRDLHFQPRLLANRSREFRASAIIPDTFRSWRHR